MSLRTPVPSSTVLQARDHRIRCFHDSLIWLCSVGWKRMPPLEAKAAFKLPLVDAAALVARLSALLSSSTLLSRAFTSASGSMPASGGFSNLHAVKVQHALSRLGLTASPHKTTASRKALLCSDSAYPFCCSSTPRSLANCRLGLLELPLILATANRLGQRLLLLSESAHSVWPAAAR